MNEQNDMAKKTLTPSEMGKLRWAGVSTEERSRQMKKLSRLAWEKLTPKQRSDRLKRNWQGISKAERTRRAKKGVATRRKRRAGHR